MFGKIRKWKSDILFWRTTVWRAQTDYQIPFRKKLKYALKGFSVNEYVWYRLEENDEKNYISELERLKAREINGAYKFILDDKLVFEEVFSKYTRVPVNYAWVNNGHIYGLHHYSVSNENILEFLKDVGESVLKWTDRGGGLGTYVLTCQDGKLQVNGEQWKEEDVCALFQRNGSAILCEYIHQSDFAASLYPHTTNTIRMVCGKEPGETEATLIAAVQRIGCQDSIPVDNAHNGGLVCAIDLETGALGCGIARLGRKENRMKPFSHHPDNNFPLCNQVIPNWETLKREIVTLTNQIPYLNFVAWDILLTNEGFCVIEGNASTGCGVFQMERGKKKEPLGRFYSTYGVY